MKTQYASIPVLLSILKNIPYVSAFFDINIQNLNEGWEYQWSRRPLSKAMPELLHDLFNPIRALHKLLKALYHVIDFPARAITDLSYRFSIGLTLFLPVVFLVVAFSWAPWICAGFFAYQMLYLTFLDPVFSGDENAMWSFLELSNFGSSHSALYTLFDLFYQGIKWALSLSSENNKQPSNLQPTADSETSAEVVAEETNEMKSEKTVPTWVNNTEHEIIVDNKTRSIRWRDYRSQDLFLKLTERSFLGCTRHNRLVI